MVRYTRNFLQSPAYEARILSKQVLTGMPYEGRLLNKLEWQPIIAKSNIQLHVELRGHGTRFNVNHAFNLQKNHPIFCAHDRSKYSNHWLCCCEKTYSVITRFGTIITHWVVHRGRVDQTGLCCLVHPGVRDKRRVSEIDLSQPRHETAFWWRHNGPVTSQLTDPIKWRNYLLQLNGLSAYRHTQKRIPDT